MGKHSTALALVVFLLLFLGIGYVMSWVDPALGLTQLSLWGLIVWGVLLFLAVVAASMYSGKSFTSARIVDWTRYQLLPATSLFSNTQQAGAS
jgi:hypothetical protein